MKVTVYKKPDGRKIITEITNVLADDEQWFAENQAKISMEEVGGMLVCYADLGLVDQEGEPDEAIEISGNRSCEHTLHALRQQCEHMLHKKANNL